MTDPARLGIVPTVARQAAGGGANLDTERRLEALTEIRRLVALGLDEQAICQHLTEAVARLLGSPYARLWVLEDETGDLVLVATAGALAPVGEIGLRRPASLANLNRAVLASGQVYQAADVGADPRWSNRSAVEHLDLHAYLGVPLLVGERRYGILTLLFPDQRTFGAGDLELVETIAAQAALAVANARAYAESRRRAEQLAALVDIDRLVSGSLDPRAVLEATAQATARLLDVVDVQLWLHDPALDVLRLGARMLAGEALASVAVPVEGSLLGRVLHSGEPSVVARVADEPLWRDVAPSAARAASGLFVPFAHQDRPLGVLVALSARERTFGDEAVRLAQALAAQAAAAIENARLYEEAQQQARRLATVLQVNRRLALGPELAEILARITEEAARLLGAEAAGLRLVEGDELVRAASFGAGSAIMVRERLPIGESLSGRVAAEGRPIVSSDLGEDPRYDPVHRAQALAQGLRAWLGAPLRGRDGVVGMLFVVTGEARQFSRADVGLLEAFADQAALAVENARLLATSERRAAEARAVAEVGRAITGSLELPAVLDLVVEQACRLLGTRRAALAIAEPEGGDAVYRFVARRGLGEQFEERVRGRHRLDGTTALAIVERRPVWSADILGDPALDLSPETRAGVEAEGYRAVLSVPLLEGDERALGALVVYRDAAGPFSANEVELLRVFADQAAIAIENARVFEREQERRRQLEAVREVAAELTRELDLTALLELVIRRSAELVGAVPGAVYLWDEADEVLVPRAWSGLGEWISTVRLRLGEGVAGLAAERRRGVIVNDYRASPHAPRIVLEQSAISAVLGEPIVYQGRLVGVITLGREGGGPPFNGQDLGLLDLFADEAAIAIENARLFEQAARVEPLRELARLKSEFLGIASHELRSPLSLLHGYTELLMHRAPHLSADEVAEMADEMHAGSSLLVRLVDDLLEVSQLEQGQLQLQRRRVALSDVVGSLVQALRSRPSGERISAELPEGLEIDADPHRLGQVVDNLLTNALRYAPGGPIILRAARRGDELRVDVTDRGPGIPPAERARVWEKFYRGKHASLSPHRGAGLGLAVVKELVELHGGRVGVTSTPGGGTTFWFTVPVQEPSHSAEGAPGRDGHPNGIRELRDEEHDDAG